MGARRTFSLELASTHERARARTSGPRERARGDGHSALRGHASQPSSRRYAAMGPRRERATCPAARWARTRARAARAAVLVAARVAHGRLGARRGGARGARGAKTVSREGLARFAEERGSGGEMPPRRARGAAHLARVARARRTARRAARRRGEEEQRGAARRPHAQAAAAGRRPRGSAAAGAASAAAAGGARSRNMVAPPSSGPRVAGTRGASRRAGPRRRAGRQRVECRVNFSPRRMHLRGRANGIGRGTRNGASLSPRRAVARRRAPRGAPAHRLRPPPRERVVVARAPPHAGASRRAHARARSRARRRT